MCFLLGQRHDSYGVFVGSLSRRSHLGPQKPSGQTAAPVFSIEDLSPAFESRLRASYSRLRDWNSATEFADTPIHVLRNGTGMALMTTLELQAIRETAPLAICTSI